MNVSIHDLSISFATCFRGRMMKSVYKSPWMYPSIGVFKLNFDGSFLKKVCIGGHGGVIRDSIGQILYCYSGLVDCFDS